MIQKYNAQHALSRCRAQTNFLFLILSPSLALARSLAPLGVSHFCLYIHKCIWILDIRLLMVEAGWLVERFAQIFLVSMWMCASFGCLNVCVNKYSFFLQRTAQHSTTLFLNTNHMFYYVSRGSMNKSCLWMVLRAFEHSLIVHHRFCERIFRFFFSPFQEILILFFLHCIGAIRFFVDTFFPIWI